MKDTQRHLDAGVALADVGVCPLVTPLPQFLQRPVDDDLCVRLVQLGQELEPLRVPNEDVQAVQNPGSFVQGLTGPRFFL